MKPAVLDENKARLIRAVQHGVPFASRPFAVLAEGLGSSEAEVISGLRELSKEGVLREISAVLEGSALGYDSALIAGQVPEAKLERAVKAINAHPTVTHNYLRSHEYNLWFTIAVPPEMSLEHTVEILADEVGVPQFYPLRRTHTFKIGVNFDPLSLKNSSAKVATNSVASVTVDEATARKFRALQRPLSIEEQPFDTLAEQADTTTEELLAFANQHLGGAIRRYVGTLRHRKLGVRENGMVVWSIHPDRVDSIGQQLANAPEVSHCYARNSIAGFPYSLYSMVHGPNRESCHDIARELSEKSGCKDYAVLFSEKEFKKQRLRYFLPELDHWWEERTAISHHVAYGTG